MRTVIHTVSVVVAFIVGLGNGKAQTTNAALTFYVVSDQRIDGGRFIDATNFPKLGYVAAKPDLTITNLVNVYPTKRSPYAIVFDTNGKWTAVPANSAPSLSIQFSPDDAKKFSALTEKSVDKRLLIMLGEKPLIAPRLLEPIESAAFEINDLGPDEYKSVESQLKKLVR